jgi:pimeloyl-ACP methyl ester carboxylesterase
MHKVRLDSRDIEMVGDYLPRKGAPFVLLSHGGGQTRHSWRGAGEHLHALGFETLSVDLRGHGETGWPSPERYTLDEFADDLLAWTAAFAEGRPVAMVGASFGGIASLLAATRPASRVDAIALVDIVPRVEMSGARRIRNFMLANPQGFATLEEAAEAVAAYRGKTPSTDHSGLAKNLRRRDDGRYYWHWDPEFMNRIPRGQERLDRLEEAARAYEGPLLLVRGLQSDVVGENGIEALRALAPQLESVDVASAGHMIASDRNDAFVEAVTGFLGRVLPVAAQ